MTAKELGWWFLGKRHYYRISGHSMEPLIRDGGKILVNPKGKLRVGELVVVQQPKSTRILVKNITQLNARDRLVYVRGINKGHSVDSDQFGWISQEYVKGVVTVIY